MVVREEDGVRQDVISFPSSTHSASSIPRRSPRRWALPVPFRHLIYLLFLDTFVEQFVIARCRLDMYVREAEGTAGEGE